MEEGSFGELKERDSVGSKRACIIFYNLSCVLSGELQEVEQLEMDEHVLVPKSVHNT